MSKVNLLLTILISSILIGGAHPLRFPIKRRGEVPAFYKNTHSASVVIEKETGRILSQKNGNIPMEMASTTKIATVYCALLHADPDQTVTITPEMCGVEGSSIYLQEGQQWTLKQLLYGTMLRSGNDAATAVAITVSGSVAAFVDQMNETAASLALKNTHFENPHGLHCENHYSTAIDLAMLTRAAFSHPLFSEIAACKSVAFTRPDGIAVQFANKNKFLTQYEGACGVKTGFTTDSGRCLVSAAKRNGMTLIGVVLNVYDMWKASETQFNAAFSAYSIRSLLGPQKTFPIPDHSFLFASANMRTYPLSEEEFSRLEYKISWHISPQKILKCGENIGEISVFLQNQLLFSEKLYTILDENVI